MLLEGLCNTSKLTDEDDQLELRNMDELLAIEKSVGEIAGAIGLQFAYENETVNLEEVEKEEFKTEDKKEAKKPVLDEDGNEIP